MKIGIVTITGENNYGQVLQNYALCNVINGLGFEAETLALKRLKVNIYRSMKENNIKFPFLKSIYLYGCDTSKKFVAHKRQKSFDEFRKNIDFEKFDFKSNYHIYEKYDYIVCGSDQIWNFNFVGKYKNFYFAKFAAPEKRVAYSASIGLECIPENNLEYFQDAINEFAAISVRENKAAELIKQHTDRDVTVTLDPTLLLDKDNWRKVEKSVPVKGKYVLTYFLGEKTKELEEYIGSIAKNNNLKIVNLYNENNYRVHDSGYNYGPAEFLWLIDNCELMITDSYHGCCFSSIFRKPFRWFSRKQKNVPNMNSRMETLFDKLQFDEKTVGKIGEFDNLFDMDYSNVETIIDKERNIALNYLKSALK